MLSQGRAITRLRIRLFVYRLVIAPNRPGSVLTVSPLGRPCPTDDVPLYQTTPVSACRPGPADRKARDTLDPQAFRPRTSTVHAARLESFEATATLWNGHRVFAVEGRTFNLPKALQQDAFKRPSPNAAYPQGRVSCLYRLQDTIPYDVDRAPGADERGDERALARHHSRLLKPEDIVVYDRGTFSRARLAHHIDQDLHAVFRIRRPNRTADTPVDQILESTRQDTLLTLKPRTMDPTPRTVRIVRIVRAPKLRRGAAHHTPR